ncbi:hypothetical protein N0V88_000643 [Collariella sp. IMI 366227]|nr:hypothetical protein N0V88_000643 [Collariella sp. IMI 366227]
MANFQLQLSIQLLGAVQCRVPRLWPSARAGHEDLAVSCFGYVLLDKEHERTMMEQFRDLELELRGNAGNPGMEETRSLYLGQWISRMEFEAFHYSICDYMQFDDMIRIWDYEQDDKEEDYQRPGLPSLRLWTRGGTRQAVVEKQPPWDLLRFAEASRDDEALEGLDFGVGGFFGLEFFVAISKGLGLEDEV